jgi:hypothetical protein
MGTKFKFYFNVIVLKLHNKIDHFDFNLQLVDQKALSSEMYGETEGVGPAFL